MISGYQILPLSESTNFPSANFDEESFLQAFQRLNPIPTTPMTSLPYNKALETLCPSAFCTNRNVQSNNIAPRRSTAL